MARPNMALYVGGMGARGKNFYNDICRDYGFEKEAVDIQDFYLEGKKAEAAAAIPGEWIMNANLVGSTGFIKERVAAFKESGVTVLSVNPIGPDPVGQIEKLRAMMPSSIVLTLRKIEVQALRCITVVNVLLISWAVGVIVNKRCHMTPTLCSWCSQQQKELLLLR
jgi:hypothetical protein